MAKQSVERWHDIDDWPVDTDVVDGVIEQQPVVEAPQFDQATADHVRRAYDKGAYVEPRVLERYGIVVVPVQVPDIAAYQA